MPGQIQKPVFVIAEIGVNHDGDMRVIESLVPRLSEAGADAVKFQSFRTELLVRESSELLPYQKDRQVQDITQFQMLKNLELSRDQHLHAQKICEDNDVEFLSTPYDVPSLEMLIGLGVGAIKIASTDTTNIPFLRIVAECGLPVILSTGACAFDEVQKAVSVFSRIGALERLRLLHCVSNYPAREDELNLACIQSMNLSFGVDVGFSDHTASRVVGAWAVFSGARLIEKHVTYDKLAYGPDHQASILPDEFAEYVSNIRHAERVFGSGEKVVQNSEKKIKAEMQKSLVAARAMKAGHVITGEDLTSMRPANGISPLDVDAVIGRRLIRKIEMYNPLTWGDISA